MKITYSKSVDACYIYLDESLEKLEKKVSSTYHCNAKEANGMINLDFDDKGKLVGIEILDASKQLPKELLDSANLE